MWGRLPVAGVSEPVSKSFRFPNRAPGSATFVQREAPVPAEAALASFFKPAEAALAAPSRQHGVGPYGFVSVSVGETDTFWRGGVTLEFGVWGRGEGLQ